MPPFNPPCDTEYRPSRGVSFRNPDIPTLDHFLSNGRTFMINNMEDYPATMYVSEVSANLQRGSSA